MCCHEHGSATTTAGTSLREQRTRCRSITVTVDTTGMSIEAVVDHIVGLLHERDAR